MGAIQEHLPRTPLLVLTLTHIPLTPNFFIQFLRPLFFSTILDLTTSLSSGTAPALTVARCHRPSRTAAPPEARVSPPPGAIPQLDARWVRSPDVGLPPRPSTASRVAESVGDTSSGGAPSPNVAPRHRPSPTTAPPRTRLAPPPSVFIQHEARSPILEPRRPSPHQLRQPAHQSEWGRAGQLWNLQPR